MKNLKVLKTKTERVVFLKNLWQTEEFKKSFNEKGYIWQKTKDFLNKPRVIANMSNTKIEHSHFYSWFNILIQKEYTNKTVQDLYYLHEIIHIATMEHKADMTYEDWQWKMLENEINASVESEVLVYKYLPIREKSFNFPIWADEVDLKSLNKSQIYLKRVEASINPKTETEKKIAQYKEQNFQWMELWKPKYQQIESFMAKKLTEQELINWIKENSSNDVLFEQEAITFSWLYWENNPKKTF